MIDYTVRIGEYRHRTFNMFQEAEDLAKKLKPHVEDVHILAERRKGHAKAGDHRNPSYT